MTTPSIQYPSAFDFFCHFCQYDNISSTEPARIKCLFTLKPKFCRYCSSSYWVFGNGSDVRATSYINVSSLRCAATLGSSWRMVPAAALRGLANSGSPDFRRDLFISLSICSLIHTSPSTIISTGRSNWSGTDKIVRTLCVTSSPTTPSPRVAAVFNLPFS